MNKKHDRLQCEMCHVPETLTAIEGGQMTMKVVCMNCGMVLQEKQVKSYRSKEIYGELRRDGDR